MLNRYYDKQALESSFGGFQGSTPFMFDGSIPGQAGRAMPVRHGTVETVRNIFNSSPDKVKSILKRYPVVSGALGIASFAGLGYGAAALADRYGSDRTAGYIAYNRYLDKVAEDSFMGRNPGTAGALIGGTVAGGMAAPRAFSAVSKIKKDPALLLRYKTKYPKGRLGLAAGIAAGIIGLGGAGIGAVGGKLMGRPEKKPGWYDRFAGYSQENPYLDKMSGLGDSYKKMMNDRVDPSFRIVAGMPSGIQDPIEYYAQEMQKDPSGRKLIDSTTNPPVLNRIISGGVGALGGGLLGGIAASAIAGRPGFFGPSDTDKNITLGGVLAGVLGGGYLGQRYLSPIISRNQASNNLLYYADGGINDKLRYMSKRDAEYRRLKKVRDRMMDIAYHNKMSIYAEHNPYLDKTAVSQALYNSAVKKRLMKQIMGYGTNPSRTVNLPVIQNSMKNSILRNRDMSALRALTSGPVTGQEGYSGLFRNINIRNNAARNTGNLTAEALREMPWYMRPLAMVS